MQAGGLDVIVVGGRVAGSTLAARLGQAGLCVLLLERDTLPSRPAASSPIIYAPAMRLLDEIDAGESQYAANTPRIHQWIIDAAPYFTVHQPIPWADGRDYAYAVDRGRFDAALWAVAAALPTVDARQRYSVLDLLHDGDQVIGVRAKALDTGERHDFYAPLVVGADGRFSLVARKTGAQTVHAHDEQPTSVYYAYWRGVRPHDDSGPAAHMISTGGDYGLLFMDSAEDTTAVVVEGRSDIVTPGTYEALLQQYPAVWARLRHAEQDTPVHGMKRVGNGYRQVGGAGWALVGDAVHQKDPLDGQGIYDALFTAKALAAAIIDWRCEGQPWPHAQRAYEQAVYNETHAMYRSTLGRVDREIYTRRPAWFMKTLARWLYGDTKYRQHWARLFVRQVDPQQWFSYRVVLPAIIRGIWHDFSDKSQQLK